MNAYSGDLVRPRPKAKSLELVLVAGAAATLGGCAIGPLANGPIDPASPVAAEVAAIANADRPYPRFSDIPKRPADEREAPAWAAATADVRATGEELVRQTAPETWTLDNTAAFAARAHEAVRDEPAFERAGGDTETFAREQRERATPPPPAR